MDTGAKTCIVTGAAGGIGAAINRKLAAQHDHLLIADANADGLERAAADLAGYGAQVLSVAADLAQPEGAAALVRAAVERFGGIDAVFNVAGIMDTRPFLEIDANVWDRIFAINVRAVFLLTQQAAKEMVRLGRGGAIVNFSSTAGRTFRPLAAHYAASKAAVISLTRSTAVALGPHKIRVNAICPGLVETPMMQGIREARAKLWHIPEDEVQKRLESVVPLGRLADPEEVADLAVFLASDQARYITGEAIGITGGTDGS